MTDQNSLTECPIKTDTGNYFVSNYPPFSQWLPEHLREFEANLQQPRAGQPLGLYVHVPFCRQRCAYCYFRTHISEPGPSSDRYVAGVLAEADMYFQTPAFSDRAFGNVYFGGGTPSLLSEPQIERLLQGLQNRLAWPEPAAEFTFECQPGTLTESKMQLLRDLGVTRASLGVQTMTDEVLRDVGRAAGTADCMDAYELARKIDFPQVNLDLIAGLPGETEASWLETIEQVIGLQPDSLTIYQLEMPHNSRMNRRLQSGREIVLPTWPTKRDWVRAAFERLREADYTIISGYWAVRDPSRQRFSYVTDFFWQGLDLLALGETAFGYLDGIHYQNVDQLAPYLEAAENGRRPLWRAYPLSDDERLRREVVLQLKTGRLDLAHFRQKFSVDLIDYFHQPLHNIAEHGWLTWDPQEIRLTDEGLLHVDWFLSQFYLPQHVGVRVS